MLRTFTGLLLVFYANAAFSQGKDTISVQTPDGSKVEAKVPRSLDVKKIGENHYEIKRTDPALKQIEIKITPPSGTK